MTEFEERGRKVLRIFLKGLRVYLICPFSESLNFAKVGLCLFFDGPEMLGTMHALPGDDGVAKRDDAVTHLLRHLHDPSALCKNPIVASYFVATSAQEPVSMQERAQALRRVLELVAASADKLLEHNAGDQRAAIHASRQHAIVRRCDLQRETHATVAADLGLSRREFYRERKRARVRLTEYLEQTRRSFHAIAFSDEFDLQWDIAASFCGAGKYDSAILTLQALAAGPNTSQRIRAYAGIVPLLGEVGRIEEAKVALGAAREIHSLNHQSGPEENLARAEIETAAARILWLIGDLKKAAAKHEWILRQLNTALPLATERAFELQALSLIRLGMLRRDFGDTRSSLRFLARASRALGSFAKPVPLLQAELLGNLSLSYMVSPNDLAKAAETMAEYLSYSREHNLMCDTADALANLTTLHLQLGDAEQARLFAQSSLKLAASVSSNQQLVHIAINAALAEATVNPRSALELLAYASSRATPGSFAWAMIQVAAAETLLAGKSYEMAREKATRAARVMGEMGAIRYVGSALRIAAEAEERLGNQTKAHGLIQEALSALQSCGHASSLAEAYACSARLTANAAHAANARDLLKDLRKSRMALVT